jgi:hypothetical protein
VSIARIAGQHRYLVHTAELGEPVDATLESILVVSSNGSSFELNGHDFRTSKIATGLMLLEIDRHGIPVGSATFRIKVTHGHSEGAMHRGVILFQDE